MVQEHSIRAALHAEAGEARVPTEELLKRIRKAGAKERRSLFPQGLRFWQVAEVVAACALLSLLFLLPALRSGFGAASAAGGSDRLIAYENETLGIRVSFPVSFDTPAIDGQGRLALRFDAGLITIGRQALPAQGANDMIVAQADLGQPVTVEQRTLAGRPATYTRFSAVEIYVVPVDSAEYVVQCGAPQGVTQAPWASLQPVCDRVLSTLELGVKFGVSREEAEAAAVAAVPGDVRVDRAVLEGHGDEKAVPPPVWRLYLVTRADGKDAGSVTVDYRTGAVVTIEAKQP